MKLSFQILVLFLSVSLLTFSCGKDEESDDSQVECEGITCENGGSCNDGECGCPQNFTGISCETPVPVISVKLNSVTVKGFPVNTTSGSAWDDNAGKPDITFQIRDVNNNILYTHGNVITDANANDNHLLNVSGFIFENPKINHSILLLDNDGSETADVIDEFQFIPEYAPGTSGIITLSNNSKLDIFVTNNY
ncbi:MAG: hypothetical protein AB8F74_15010 [Saprospiraceae bacterium]